MKQLFFIGAMTLATVTGFCQEKKEPAVKPPAAAEAAFKKAYPAAAQVKWTSEKSDFEVNFKDGKKEMSAVYSAAGVLQETEEEISHASLPAAATAYLKQHYKEKVKGAEKLTDKNGKVSYEVEVGETEVIFDANGNFIKAEKEEKE
jgi:hypothetical protein